MGNTDANTLQFLIILCLLHSSVKTSRLKVLAEVALSEKATT